MNIPTPATRHDVEEIVGATEARLAEALNSISWTLSMLAERFAIVEDRINQLWSEVFDEDRAW